DIVVFYGNRDPECMPYLDELGAMGSIGVRVVPVYERDAPPGAAAGLISPELVERYVDARDGRPVLVTGPPLMVTAMESVLDEVRVPQDARLIERFGPAPRPARTSGKE
ncbi:MAG: hypothetical protein HY876_08045, partial [Coriobacteriales bacterium]|nr:hypothetical protein [Coriobacteriales bacterium]